jgi:hypothetical protein
MNHANGTLLLNDATPAKQFDFGTAVPSNFVFSPDSRYLFGSLFTGGVEHLRYEIATGELEALTNADTGFFRPVRTNARRCIPIHRRWIAVHHSMAPVKVISTPSRPWGNWSNGIQSKRAAGHRVPANRVDDHRTRPRAETPGVESRIRWSRAKDAPADPRPLLRPVVLQRASLTASLPHRISRREVRHPPTIAATIGKAHGRGAVTSTTSWPDKTSGGHLARLPLRVRRTAPDTTSMTHRTPRSAAGVSK